MAKNLLPWSLKGVSLEARARAKAAAGETGEPLGKWLSETIRQTAAAEAAKPAPQIVPAGPIPAPMARADGPMIDRDSITPEASVQADEVASSPTPDDGTSSPIVLAVELPSAASSAPATQPAIPAATDPPADWQTAYERLARRLDESDRRMVTALDRVLARLHEVERPRRRGWRWPKLWPSRRGR